MCRPITSPRPRVSSHPSVFVPPRTPGNLCSALPQIIWNTSESRVGGATRYVLFWSGLFACVVGPISRSLTSVVAPCMGSSHFLCPPVGEHSGCVQTFLAVRDKASRTMTHTRFHSTWVISENGTTGSLVAEIWDVWHDLVGFVNSFPFFSLFFGLDTPMELYSNLPILPSFTSILLYNLPSTFFIPDTHFLSSNIATWFLFTYSISLLRFKHFFLCCHYTFPALLSVVLKTIISGLTPVNCLFS